MGSIKNTSKFISLILRHKPDAIGIVLDEHGWADVPTAKKVGMRHGKPVIYSIDCAKMAADGYRFYLSANHVWLTKSVPVKYLNKCDG